MAAPSLKLPRLPDRKPVRLSISVEPDLFEDLKGYAEVYAAIYGEKKSVSDLTPFMLRAFIDSDAAFKRARKQRSAGGASAPVDRNSKSADAQPNGEK